MSNKRILLALILAGTLGFLGLHRFYTGRYYTGLAQLITFAIGAAILWPLFASLETIHSLDDYVDWFQTHPIQPVPWLLVGFSCTWAIVDCYILLSRKFKDGAGIPMTRWI